MNELWKEGIFKSDKSELAARKRVGEEEGEVISRLRLRYC